MRNKKSFFVLLLLYQGCGYGHALVHEVEELTSMKNNIFELSTSAFTNMGSIPARYTCDQSNISPALVWRNVPQGTKSFALIVDDPDAPSGTFVHWVVYNMPASLTELSEALPAQQKLDNRVLQGTNSFEKIGYGGPCPPKGHGKHRYFFKLYALDTMLALQAGATKDEVINAMQGHIIAHAELVGTYERKKA